MYLLVWTYAAAGARQLFDVLEKFGPMAFGTLNSGAAKK